MNKKSLIASVLIAIAVVGVVGYFAYAVLSWHGSITWTVQTQFSVWSLDSGGVQYDSPYISGQGVLTPGPYSFAFWLQNDGNVPVTVTVANPSAIGADPVWSDGGTWTIPVGPTRTLATLTLTVTDTGSYSWDFV